ncbi:MAG: hypothetical protein A3G04_01780 [Candidatus Taylorbacteria bacterium RIFCSPLOWO2_12_FULL_44_9]|nr:MAG: hypothetical protein A3G04_01780 [Candidatus Taylorbacteria bacterium RIFCSPLOWO2_12_FULL_44_9]
MDKTIIEKQKNLALQRLEKLGDKDESEKKAVAIVSEYLSSLLHPEAFTDVQKDDLRKLALEFGYKEDTDFNKWTPTLSVTAK